MNPVFLVLLFFVKIILSKHSSLAQYYDFNYHDEMIGKYVIQEYGEAHMEGINKILLVISHFRKSSVYKVIKNAKSHFCTLSKFKRSEANKRAIELRSGYIENLFKMCQSEEEDPEI